MPSLKDVQSKNSMKRLLSKAGNELVIAEFYATWCGNCTKVAPAYEQLAEKYADSAQFVKVDVDKVENILPSYQITKTPAFVLLKKGKIIAKYQGSNMGMLEAIIQKHRAPNNVAPFTSYDEMCAFMRNKAPVPPKYEPFIPFKRLLLCIAGFIIFAFISSFPPSATGSVTKDANAVKVAFMGSHGSNALNDILTSWFALAWRIGINFVFLVLIPLLLVVYNYYYRSSVGVLIYNNLSMPVNFVLTGNFDENRCGFKIQWSKKWKIKSEFLPQSFDFELAPGDNFCEKFGIVNCSLKIFVSDRSRLYLPVKFVDINQIDSGKSIHVGIVGILNGETILPWTVL